MTDIPDNRKTPLWMTIVIIVCALPVLAFPTMLASTSADSPARTFVWLYPFYVIAAAVCARICYPSRPEVTWILLVLMILSHAAMWVLINNPG